MTGTVPDLIKSTAKRTKLTTTYVNQRAREIQNAGLLPVAVGSSYAKAKPRDLTNLLIALAADKVRQAPAFVSRYVNLRRRIPTEYRKAGDALEAMIANIWRGDGTQKTSVIRIVQTWQQIILQDADSHCTYFYDPNDVIDLPWDDTAIPYRHSIENQEVRRSLEIPGTVIAEIGADMGMRGCAYAL
jgi:hypothetical protein